MSGLGQPKALLKCDNGTSETARSVNSERPLTTSSESSREGLGMKPTHCVVCGSPLTHPDTGRPRRFCSVACRGQEAVNPCKCGCGHLVVKNYKRGHSGRRPLPDRFWQKVNKTDACWLWTGFLDPAGYGRINVKKAPRLAHRVSYELVRGPIPDGLDLDHLCRVRNCVNPSHLEPVTRAENLRRGMAPNMVAARTNTCKHGHSLEDAYVRATGDRACRTCQKRRNDDRHLIGPDLRRDLTRGSLRLAIHVIDTENPDGWDT